jgi:hypothetical protein
MAASCSDTAPEAGAPGDEIEVTPEMLEVGLLQLLMWNPNRCNEEDTVIALYQAMVLARRSPPTSRQGD